MRYALTIKGRVQNAGYRNFIEERARDRRLKGYVFNKRDGTVNVVCECAQEKIDDFVDVITLHEEEDVFVEDILKDELLDTAYPMPDTFGRVRTDTKEDTNRKLDKGVNAIKSVKEDTVLLPGLLQDIKKDTGLLKDVKGILESNRKILESNQKILESNQKDQKTVIGILEKNTGILERIADK